MSPLHTPTPTLLLMTTPTPTSMQLRLVMVLVMLRDPTQLLFLMVVSSTLTTRLMDMLDMLLMSPMMELLSTQMPLPQLLLLQPMPVKMTYHELELDLGSSENDAHKRTTQD